MLRDGFAERVERFVEKGGTFVATWLTGVVGPTNLCFRGGFPGPLRKVLGVWAEETDYLYDDERNSIECAAGNALGLQGSFGTGTVCEVVHPEGAAVAATYGRDFYAGSPALTVNRFGKGEAWYLATWGDDAFLDAFHAALAARRGLRRALEATNFASEPRAVDLGPAPRKSLLDGGATVSGTVELPPFGVLVLAEGAV